MESKKGTKNKIVAKKARSETEKVVGEKTAAKFPKYSFEASSALKNILAKMEAYKTGTGCRGVALGLSGGKDSTVVACLAKKVFGANALALLMPDGVQSDIADSEAVAKTIGIEYAVINIQAATKAILGNGAIATKAVLGDRAIEISRAASLNVPPRVRMAVLYAAAQSRGYRVIGTGNLSESYVGWCTKFGDTACDFNPIANLTKTEVVAIGALLAHEFNLDVSRFIEKVPADGLTGKSDEENFGFSYAVLDNYIRTGICADAAIKAKIDAMHRNSQHKREMPVKF